MTVDDDGSKEFFFQNDSKNNQHLDIVLKISRLWSISSGIYEV